MKSVETSGREQDKNNIRVAALSDRTLLLIETKMFVDNVRGQLVMLIHKYIDQFK